MANCLLTPTPIQIHTHRTGFVRCFSESVLKFRLPPAIRPRLTQRIFCNYDDTNRNNQTQSSANAIQLYRDIERYNYVLYLLSVLEIFYGFLIFTYLFFSWCVFRLLTESVRQSQGPWGGSSDWSQVEVLYDFNFLFFIPSCQIVHSDFLFLLFYVCDFRYHVYSL